MVMDIRTHTKIDQALCGTPEDVSENYARVRMTATSRMAVDDSGLVHGGFIFGLADYAAMLAVNHPNVVLGAADVRFLKPVKPEETLIAVAQAMQADKKKNVVEVAVFREDEKIFTGRFDCFVLDKHVLA
jgi:uncharacterized protein (TIGR00369 family)